MSLGEKVARNDQENANNICCRAPDGSKDDRIRELKPSPLKSLEKEKDINRKNPNARQNENELCVEFALTHILFVAI